MHSKHDKYFDAGVYIYKVINLLYQHILFKLYGFKYFIDRIFLIN